jgi:hypothetical protein
MSQLSAALKRRCLRALDQLEKHYISRMFARPVDPTRDNCPTYFQVIQSPMDLGTVRRKLETDQYATIEQWRSDMDLIWNNTLAFNGAKSLLSVVAKQLQTHFREISAFLSADIESDWAAKFEKLKTEFQGLVKTAPKAPLTSRVLRPPIATRSSVIPLPPKLPERFGREKTPGMTTEEIVRLADDVNLIEDSDQVDQILDLIRTMEPHYPLDSGDDELELEMANLEPGTLLELRALVTRLLGR